jgi:hypothetical protein
MTDMISDRFVISRGGVDIGYVTRRSNACSIRSTDCSIEWRDCITRNEIEHLDCLDDCIFCV